MRSATVKVGLVSLSLVILLLFGSMHAVSAEPASSYTNTMESVRSSRIADDTPCGFYKAFFSWYNNCEWSSVLIAIDYHWLWFDIYTCVDPYREALLGGRWEVADARVLAVGC